MKQTTIVRMDSLREVHLNPEHIRRVTGAILRTCDEHSVDICWTARDAAQRLLQHAMSSNGLCEDDTLGVSCAPHAWRWQATPPFLLLELVAINTLGCAASVGRYVFSVEPAPPASHAGLATLSLQP